MPRPPLNAGSFRGRGRNISVKPSRVQGLGEGASKGQRKIYQMYVGVDLSQDPDYILKKECRVSNSGIQGVQSVVGGSRRY